MKNKLADFSKTIDTLRLNMGTLRDDGDANRQKLAESKLNLEQCQKRLQELEISDNQGTVNSITEEFKAE